MRRGDLVIRLASVTVIVAAAALAAATLSPRAAALATAEPASGLEASFTVGPARPDSLARLVAARNPFRLSRSAARTAYRLGGEQPAPVLTTPTAPRPVLALAGVIMDDDPVALIDGLPGVEGTRVVRVGEQVGDYQLRSLTADSAIVAGPDTVWTLGVRSRFP